MRSVAIVGAGQAGLQLALGLCQNGYEVTLVSERSSDEILNGPVMSSQIMFDRSLGTERDLGLELWAGRAPSLKEVTLSEVSDRGRPSTLSGRLDGPALSVDQRLKFSTWLNLFCERGGRLIVRRATTQDLEELSRSSELLVLASGKGALASMLGRREGDSPFQAPQRRLAVVYLVSGETGDSGLSLYQLRGLGEIVVTSGLTRRGRCEIVNLEAIPGGPWDVWPAEEAADARRDRMIDVLARHLPWEAARLRHAALSDPGATLVGAITPVVRDPVGELPSGARFLGLADAVCVNDPLTGQGANTAALAASWLVQDIVARGALPFDEAWMRRAFQRFWDYAHHVTAWTNAWLHPAPLHRMVLMHHARHHPAVAGRILRGFEDPPSLSRLFTSPEGAYEFLQSVGLSGIAK